MQSADYIDKLAAECVEELLESVATNGGVPWFLIIQRKLISAVIKADDFREKGETFRLRLTSP